MSVPTSKMAAIGFIKPPFDPALDSLESLVTFGVLCQLGRLMDLHVKDLALSSEKAGIDPRIPQVEWLDKLRRIATANRVQYIWTGQLSYALRPEDKQTAFKVIYRLYDSFLNRVVLDEIFYIERQPHEQCATVEFSEHLPAVDVNQLNILVHQAALQCWQLLNEGRSSKEKPILMPLSTSLTAIYQALLAHQSIRPEDKIFHYEAALREDPQMEIAYAHLARLYKNEQLYEKSVHCYREALKHAYGAARNKALYATEAGIACALLGKHDFALQWWLRATEYDPAYLNPYFNIANIYEDQDNLKEAVHYFLRAQQLAPSDFRTYSSLGRLYSKLGEWEKALAQYNRQLEMESDDPWCHSDVATCYLNLGDAVSAKEHLQRTVTLDPVGEAGQYAQLILSGMNVN